MTELVFESLAAPPTAGRRWRAVVVMLVGVALVAGGLLARSWQTGERLFYGGGWRGAHVSLGASPGQTVYFGMGLEGRNGSEASRRVELRSVTPIVSENTSAAGVAVLMCTDAGGSATLGSTARDPRPYCATLTAFTPGTVTLGPRATGLLLAVTPHLPGVVRIEGVRISYRTGLRSGTQRVGVEAIVLTK